MQPEKIEFQPTYKRESGLGVIDLADIPLPAKIEFPESSLVYIPPQEMGGNHKHPRIEAFVAFGKGMTLVWRAEDEMIHEEKMTSDEGLVLFVIPSYLPHAVINRSDSDQGILIEFASEKQHDVEQVQLI